MARTPTKTPTKTPNLQQLDKSLRVPSLGVEGRDRVAPPPITAATRPSLGTLLRLGGWGFSMALALGMAVTVARTDRGVERIQQVFASLNGPAKAPAAATTQVARQVGPTAADPMVEIGRLAVQIEALKTDREKLVTRVATLENNLDDVTGSVRQTAQRIAAARATDGVDDDPAADAADRRENEPLKLVELPEAAAPPRKALRELTPLPRPAPASMVPVAPAAADGGGGALPVPLVMHPTVIAATSVGIPPHLNPAVAHVVPDETGRTHAARPSQAASLARLEPAAAPAHETRPPARLAYGIDLGGAGTIDALRALWAATKAEHAPQLDHLQPAVVLRPTGKGGAPQLRLMAGPFADAGAAAALCKTFVAGRGTCRPFAFDGHKLPLN